MDKHNPCSDCRPAGASESALVTIIVLYYKRRATILEVIRAIFSQDYPHLQLILVDNASKDDLRDAIGDYLSRIELIQLDENLGACGGRNVAIRKAKGEFIAFVDDDMILASTEEISKAVEMFQSRPNSHVLAFKVCDPDTGKLRMREWCHPRPWQEFSEKEFETHWFCEGASIFRRNVFEKCGNYYEPLFYGAEGHDLAVRILDNGFRITYSPNLRIGHRAAEEGRTTERQIYYYTRNFVWMAYKDYHAWQGLRFVIPKIVMMFYFALRMRTLKSFIKGCKDGLRGLRVVGKSRTPARGSTLRYWNTLERYRPSIWTRLIKHIEAPQI